MPCRVPPFADAVLAEATRLSPTRRRSSDGCCADAAHYQTGGDHVPSGPNNYAHAVDVSHSVPGAPFWQSHYGRFDAMAYALKIAARRDPRVKYMVANFGGPDMIWNPSVSHLWRQNGSAKYDHRSHLHVSFTVAAEQSTAPFFAPEDDMTPEELRKELTNFRALVKSDTIAVVRKFFDEELPAQRQQIKSDTIAVVRKVVPQVLEGYTDDGVTHEGILEQYGLSKT